MTIHVTNFGIVTGLVLCCGLWIYPRPAAAQEPDVVSEVFQPSDVLTAQKWRALDSSIDRGLDYLARQQQTDGSFPTRVTGNPGVTSLCAMAFMADGHVPGSPTYGGNVSRAIDFVLASQRDDGLLSVKAPSTPVTNWYGPTHTAMYNHAIAGLMLCEAYGMVPADRLDEMTTAIEKAIAVTHRKQLRPGPNEIEDGGWGYWELVNRPPEGEADLSVTAWHMMFLRSAENAGFDIPKEKMDAAAGFVKNCFQAKTRRFTYGAVPADRSPGRGMTGAGILSLAMAGQHETEIAKIAGDWLLEHPFDQYNAGGLTRMDRFHYSAHYVSHGMYQLGGRHWKGFYPVLVDTMLSGQTDSGAWQKEQPLDATFGQTYTTALAILALSPPYQILPIYQR